MKGRHTKPTALKVLQGNPGKGPLPKNEPKPTGRAVKPEWLAPDAAAVWDQYAPIVEKMGLLTDADAETFARWCQLSAEFRRLQSKFPAAKMTRMDNLESRFGLDPSSRARLGASGIQQPESNPFQATG